VSSSELGVPEALLPRLHELAERLGRPAQQLVREALERYLEELEADEAPEPGFDEVVFGEGESALTFGAEQFRQLPLRRQVHLLLSKAPRFFRGGREIPRAQAMSLRGVAKG
jgi:predicted DNA-binding protein